MISSRQARQVEEKNIFSSVLFGYTEGTRSHIFIICNGLEVCSLTTYLSSMTTSAGLLVLPACRLQTENLPH